MSKEIIKPGTVFRVKNLLKLQEFSINLGNPSKSEFDVLLGFNKEFIVVKL